MATVVQIIATNENDPHFEANMVNNDWHAMYFIDAPRTVCGVQLEGDDGYAPGPEKSGRVTCEACRIALDQIQSIKRWR